MFDNSVSQHYAKISAESFAQFGYDVIPWNAITPHTYFPVNTVQFADNKLRHGKKKPPFTHTEMAVWHSHYSLWKHSSTTKQDIIVIEHDTILIEDIPDLSRLPAMLLAGSGTGTIWAGSAYYITYEAATDMIKMVGKFKQDANVDGVIYHNVIRQLFNASASYLTKKQRLYIRDVLSEYSCCKPYIDHSVGTTIEHTK